MYNQIIVAFDGSEFSKGALKEASIWVMKHGGKVIIVNAVHPDGGDFGTAPSDLKGKFELAKKICNATAETNAADYDIEVEPLVREGEPADILIDTAREKNADLIAMGTYGRRSLKRLFLGSVTSEVVINSPCDVLIVKKPCTECIGKYDSILVPFDGSEFSKKALKRACSLSKFDSAKITAMYVIPRYEEMIEFLATGSIKEKILKESQKIINEAEKIASAEGIAIKTEIQEGYVVEKIVLSAGKTKNNLIAMGSYGWRGINKAIMGSSTERIVINAACPVLVVK